MKDEIKEIINKFDKVLENYELDKKFGQMSVDSICHLFPNEMTIIKDCITNLQEENEKLIKYNKICKKYLHNHERDYIDELGIICCKPSEYFNIAWAQDILDGNIEGFEDLLQGSDDNE